MGHDFLKIITWLVLNKVRTYFYIFIMDKLFVKSA